MYLYVYIYMVRQTECKIYSRIVGKACWSSVQSEARVRRVRVKAFASQLMEDFFILLVLHFTLLMRTTFSGQLARALGSGCSKNPKA